MRCKTCAEKVWRQRTWDFVVWPRLKGLPVYAQRRMNDVRITDCSQCVLKGRPLSAHRLRKLRVTDLGMDGKLHERAAVIVFDEAKPNGAVKCDRFGETLYMLL